MDSNDGAVVQVKKSAEVEIPIDIVQVVSNNRKSSGFDISALFQKKVDFFCICLHLEPEFGKLDTLQS